MKTLLLSILHISLFSLLFHTKTLLFILHDFHHWYECVPNNQMKYRGECNAFQQIFVQYFQALNKYKIQKCIDDKMKSGNFIGLYCLDLIV